MGHLCWPWEGGREREKQWERVCVCSCSLVCLVQNWFKAPGHRKKATLHSRHVPETSSRGSTIAIQQRRLQTPKWVCSVLQCPTWQSATYSTSPAPNMPSHPLLLLFLYSLFYFMFFFLSVHQSPISTFSLTVFLAPALCMSVALSAHAFHLAVTFSLRLQSIMFGFCILIGFLTR